MKTFDPLEIQKSINSYGNWLNQFFFLFKHIKSSSKLKSMAVYFSLMVIKHSVYSRELCYRLALVCVCVFFSLLPCKKKEKRNKLLPASSGKAFSWKLIIDDPQLVNSHHCMFGTKYITDLGFSEQKLSPALKPSITQVFLTMFK